MIWVSVDKSIKNVIIIIIIFFCIIKRNRMYMYGRRKYTLLQFYNVYKDVIIFD